MPFANEPHDDMGSKPVANQNTQSGQADYVVQARDIHGGVHVGFGRRRTWVSASIIGVAGVVAAVIVTWPHSQTPASTSSPGPGPIDLHVGVDLTSNDQGLWGYVNDSPTFPGTSLISRLERPGAAIDVKLTRDVRQTGAAKLKNQTVLLTFQGPRDRSVRITDIRPVVRSKQAPLNGTLVWAPPQGTEDSAEALLSLDDQFPVLQVNQRDGFGQPHPTGTFFPSKTIHLNPGETTEVVLTTLAKTHSYTYELDIVYQSDAGAREQIVNDHGQPFRITGLACTASGVASYRAAYELRGDLSMTPDSDPSHVNATGEC